MVDMSASQIIRRNFCFAFANVLFLLIIVLLGMNTNVSGRPIEWSDSSAEDILAGVDFLSVFMNSAEERKTYTHKRNNVPQPEITTHHPTTLTNRITTEKPFEELIFEHATSTTFDNSLINKNEEEDEAPTTTNLSNEEFTTILPEEPVETTTFQVHPEITTKRGTFVKAHPSAIQSNSKRNIFNIDISEPITIESQKVKRKSEDLLAIGANPDYIAQQHARINRDNQYNRPYNPASSSRGRSVSYSTVIQVVPPEPVKPWKQEDDSSNFGSDEDYTESYPDYGTNKTFKHVASTAESKDYFVTRKYNPGEFNESGDKDASRTNLEVKKNYQTTERNWGVPEKNYGLPEKNYGQPQYGKQLQLQQEIVNVNYQTTERNWGLPEKQYSDSRGPYGHPEQNYEVDEAISVRTNGRTHGVQEQKQPSEKPLQFKVGQNPVKPDDNQKVGYVVEGRNYRKYRVEERTPDGFIVGEYGVVSNNDGSLRGVRYTADGTINPRVIYDALMKFLAL